jgi:hypothetical protein
MPSDIFEAKGEVDDEIPSEGGIEPLDPIKRNRDPYDNSLTLFGDRRNLPIEGSTAFLPLLLS